MMVLGGVGAMLMGIVLGLIGGGGSILTVPILVYFFNFPGTSATYHSLFIVGICAALGVLPFFRRKLVEFRVALFFLFPALLGMRIARRLVLPWIPERFLFFSYPFSKDLLILSTFAMMMILAARAMLRVQQEVLQPDLSQRHFLRVGANGLGVGFLTGFVGAGGGFMIVPALTNGVNLSMERAVGTSLMIIAFNSLSGFLGDWMEGVPVHWDLMIPVTVIAMIGILLGTYLHARIPSRRLKPLFGWFVLIVGTGMFVQQLMAWISNRSL